MNSFRLRSIAAIFFTVAAVVATPAVALTPAQERNAAVAAINAKLPPGIVIENAQPGQVANATEQAIADAGLDPAIRTVTLVDVALGFAPTFSPELAGAGLNDVQGDVALSAVSRQSQAAGIVAAAMNSSFFGVQSGFAGVQDPSDGAAAVTAVSVNAVKGANDAELLNTVVRTAVITAQSRGTGSQSGVGGAVTGAISQVAGNSNGNVTDNVPTLNPGPGGLPVSNDELVLRVIRTAAASAPARVGDISLAVGYAFAAAYRATTADGLEISALTFQGNNLAALEQAIMDGLQEGYQPSLDRLARLLRRNLPRAQRRGFQRQRNAILAAIADDQGRITQINSGIAIAYTPGFEGPGDEGIAFNVGSTQPVTNVQNL